MKTKLIILVSALSLLFVSGLMAQASTTFTDYVAKGTTYLFGCDTIQFNGGTRTIAGENATLILQDRLDAVKIERKDSIYRGEKYLYGCDVFTDSTTICDTIHGWERDTIYIFSLRVQEPEPIKVLLLDTICNGQKYLFGCEVLQTDTIISLRKDTTIERTDTISLSSRDSIVTLHLTVSPPDTFSTTQRICSGDSIQLVDGDATYYSRDIVFTRVITNGYGCRCIGTYELTVIKPDTTTLTDTICSDSEYQFGDTTLTTSGTYYRTIPSLTPPMCDSVIRLELVVRACITVNEPVKGYVCSGEVYRGRLTSHTITERTMWTDFVRAYVDGAQVDSLYHYDIAPYLQTLPVISDSSVIVRCGKAIDITKANSIVQDHITAMGEAYAPNAVITWQWFDNNAWQDLPGTTAIRGGVNDVQVRCAVTTDCGLKDTTLTVPVAEPTPENDSTMDNMPASSMYGNRLLIVNKHAIDSIYGWDIKPADVVWYSMTGAAPDVAVDESVHTGLYYTADEAFAGKYYARITHQSVNASDCGGILRTVVLTCTAAANSLSPQLIPTVAHPAEQMRLLNLNAATVTEIRVYNTSGELQSSYTSAEATEFLFRAAHSAGYYLVDVVTEDSKVTLRYIVK